MKSNKSVPLSIVKAQSQELLEMIDEFLIDLYKELIKQQEIRDAENQNLSIEALTKR